MRGREGQQRLAGSAFEDRGHQPTLREAPQRGKELRFSLESTEGTNWAVKDPSVGFYTTALQQQKPAPCLADAFLFRQHLATE